MNYLFTMNMIIKKVPPINYDNMRNSPVGMVHGSLGPPGYDQGLILILPMRFKYSANAKDKFQLGQLIPKFLRGNQVSGRWALD